MHDPEGGSFQLYTVNLDGSNLKQITTEAEWGEEKKKMISFILIH